MKRQAKTTISTRIEANKDKIYRTNDLYDLSTLIFPNKNAKELRTAFILIFLAIKGNQDRRITTPELENFRKEKAPELSQKSLWKARATMARLGIITRRDGIYWQFSTKFGKSLQNLADKTTQYMATTESKEQEEKEWFTLEYAKTIADAAKNNF